MTLNPDMPSQTLRLHMGELTTDEMLVARAAIRWANAENKPVKKQLPCPAECDDGVDWSSGTAEVCDECEGSGTFYVMEGKQP